MTKTYENGVHAMRGVTLNIDRGLFGLLGPNGAGKSSLMRTLATLQEPDEGTDHPRRCRRSWPTRWVIAGGLAICRRTSACIPASPRWSCSTISRCSRASCGRAERKGQTEALLARTNLWEHRKRAVSGFSGGMRQRFGIAQALLGDPRLVIVDEPTAGLDPEERNRFHNLLSEIGENVVVILSTHIVEDVRQLCQRMAILADGRVLQQGEPDALVRALRGRVWGKTVAKHEVAAHRQSMRVLSAQLHAGKTRLRVLADNAPDRDFEPMTPDLEDVYFLALRERRCATGAPRPDRDVGDASLQLCGDTSGNAVTSVRADAPL